VNVTAKNGATALGIAEAKGHGKTALLLRAAGGVTKPFEPNTLPKSMTPFDQSPKPLNAPRPNYTPEARAGKTTGVVRTRLLVDRDGRVKTVYVFEGLPDGLTDEAIRAAGQMMFTPAKYNGKPVVVWVRLDITFGLK
jgi:TonB family protein